MRLTNILNIGKVYTLSAIALLLFVSASNFFESSAQKLESVFEVKNDIPTNEVILAGTISGRVFQDFNGNGTYDTTTIVNNDGFGTIGVAIDQGIGGVTVSAYNSSGAISGTATSVAGTGNYTLNATGTGPFRLEFTTVPTGYNPSARSTDSVLSGSPTTSGSTVQFVNDGGSTDVNLALNYPTDYSQNNPEVLAALYESGNAITGGNSAASVLQSFPYSAGSSDSATTATEGAFDAPTLNPLDVASNQVGATFGQAYARRTRSIYVGAFFKRHAGFGPGTDNTANTADDPVTIYVVGRTGSGAVTSRFTVPGTATNAHEIADYNRDNGNTGWDGVGKTSLGGLALSEDETRLYVWNLANRTLYALNATNGALIASQAAPTTLPLPTGNCVAADVRPFAVTVYHGQLYAGFVCSAQSTGNVDTFTDSNGNGIWDQGDYFVDTNNNSTRDTGESYYELTGNTVYNTPEPFTDTDGNGIYNLGDARGLRAYVYTVDSPTATTLAFGAAPVFQMPLNYRRGLTTHTENAVGAWRPWSTTYRSGVLGNRTVYSQPMLVDIAFDNGNLVLGFRDRVGDQVGNGTLSNPNDASNTNVYQPRTAGDVIRACGAANSWAVEANGRCNSTGTAPQNVAEGPGGGEFYFGDAYDLSDDFIAPAVNILGKGGNHADTGNGGVEQLPGAPDVIISNFDPVPNIANLTHDGGIRWLSNSNGSFTKAYRLFNGNGNDGNVFAKAGGIGGSLTILSNPAPIEIGNRVWRDTDGDGVQDPGENGIAGVTVRLYQGNTLVGTAVTDANGEYYFVTSTVADPTPGDNVGQVSLNGGILYNTAYQVRFDLPANFATGGPLAGLLLTRVNQTTQLGDDDSSDSDANTVTNPAGSPTGSFPVIAVTTGSPGSNNHTFDVGFALPPSAANVILMGRITTSNGNGIRNIKVFLTESDGTVHQTTTGSFGYYVFEEISGGQNVVVGIASKRYTFPQTTRLVTLGEDVTELDWVSNE